MTQSASIGSGDMAELPTEAAYKSTLPEMAALGQSGLSPINVDVVNAVTTVLACLPELRAIRPEIEKHLPTFNLQRFDKLEQYTLALNHANAIHRGTLASRVRIADLGGEVADLRDRLLDDARSLANHRLLDGDRLRECKKSPSYRAIATDVFTLVALFKEHWPKVAGRTPVTTELMQQAGNRALDLLGAVGDREQAGVSTNEAQLTRQQAYTLFLRAYEDARSAVEYLRRDQGDANTIIPSFYTGRGGRGGNAANAGGAAEASSSDAGSEGAAIPANGEPPAIQINNPHNLPIDAPYVN